ncbi:MAG: FHA domain-containing protein [Lentisphaerales bacterium]|nr:FHA domain-containing protein [Lentisphaerales bacterium]
MDKFQTQINLPPMTRTSGSSGIFKANSFALDATSEELIPSFYIFCDNQKKNIRIPKDKDLFIIGKGEHCDIVLSDQSLSSEQIAVIRLGDQCFFMDRGSTDCVFFNGVKSRQTVIHQEGRMIIKVGKTLIIYIGINSKNYNDPKSSVTLKRSLNAVQEYPNNPEAELLIKSKSGEMASAGLPILVGSHKVCDYKVNGIEPFHYYIYFSPSGVFIEDLTHGAPGIRINDMNTLGATPVEEDRTISISAFKMFLYVYGNIASRCGSLFKTFEEKPALALTLLSSPEAGQLILPRSANKLIVGRHSESDLMLDDVSISREHAFIQVREKGLNISDNGSSNGTFHNLKKIDKVTAHAGDIVEFGSAAFLLHYAY